MELGPARKKTKKDKKPSQDHLKIEKDKLSIILDLPIEISDWIIVLLKPDDRARFAKCAKVTNEAVKRSKNYIYGLSFCEEITKTVIYISHQPKANYSTNVIHNAYDCHYDFQKIHGRNFKTYYTKSSSMEEILDDDVDLNEASCQFFKQLLSKYQKHIRTLSMNIYENRDFDFGIEKLPNVRDVALSGDFDISSIMTAIHQPLDNLEIRVDDHSWVNSDYFDRILKTRIALTIPNNALNNQQFLNLRARDLECQIGNLSEETIAEFIKSYKNDTLNRNAGYYNWTIPDRDTGFDVRKLWRLLGSEQLDLSRLLAIKHSTKRKIAYLNFEKGSLKWRNMLG